MKCLSLPIHVLNYLTFARIQLLSFIPKYFFFYFGSKRIKKFASGDVGKYIPTPVFTLAWFQPQTLSCPSFKAQAPLSLAWLWRCSKEYRNSILNITSKMEHHVVSILPFWCKEKSASFPADLRLIGLLDSLPRSVLWQLFSTIHTYPNIPTGGVWNPFVSRQELKALSAHDRPFHLQPQTVPIEPNRYNSAV